MLIPFILSGYIINGVEMLIVPIMGRSGSGNYAELVLSFIMSIMLVLMFSFYVSFEIHLQWFKSLETQIVIFFKSEMTTLNFFIFGTVITAKFKICLRYDTSTMKFSSEIENEILCVSLNYCNCEKREGGSNEILLIPEQGFEPDFEPDKQKCSYSGEGGNSKKALKEL